MSFKAYFFSKVFLLNFLLVLGVTIVILVVTFYGIRVYTNHGESFAVPDFSGLGMEQVETMTNEKNLVCEIVDSLYTKEAKPGSVIDQVPAPGFYVKEGRTVFLTICAKYPEQVAMPKLTDISFRQAVNIIQSIGLNVGEVKYIPSEYPNLVLSQKIDGAEIANGTLINRGSSVDLLIGKSSSGEKTVIPNLIDVTLEQAKREISSLFLNVGAVIFDESVVSTEDSLKARIWMQRPEADSVDEIELGTSIDLWLTVDEEKINPEMEKDLF